MGHDPDSIIAILDDKLKRLSEMSENLRKQRIIDPEKYWRPINY